MISLKPFLYGPTKGSGPESDSDLPVVVSCFGNALSAFGKGAAQDGSAHGIQLEQLLARLQGQIAAKPSAGPVKESTKQAVAHIERWGEAIAADSKAKADEIKELLIALAKTAESVGSRDKTFNAEFHLLTGRLEKVADLNDLTQIKASLVKHVTELKHSVDQMARDNLQLVSNLKAQVTTYENKLKSVENIAFRDDLTGMPNRRSIEREIVSKIKRNESFWVVMFDLNGFKLINDKYGHSAGDDLLRKFSTELTSRTRARGLVGRWGGDEFVALMTCTADEALNYIGSIKSWVFGKYQINVKPGGAGVEVFIDAAIGLAEWKNSMSVQQIIADADTNMYENKRSLREARSRTTRL